jgi:hypothetical protein
MSDFDTLMEENVGCLRRVTVQHNALVRRAVPQGTQQGSETIDQAWHGLRAAQPALRALEDEAIRALSDLYNLHQDYDEIRKAIASAEAQWVYHAIFSRAAESTTQEEDRSS